MQWMDIDGLLLNSQCLANKCLLNKMNDDILTIWMFGFLLNDIHVSNLFAFKHNAAVNVLGIINFFCTSNDFLLTVSQKCNYTLGQKDMSILKVLGTYYQIAFQKGCINLYFHKRYVRGTFHCTRGG